MGLTKFTTKESLDKLYASEINAIHIAVNSLESAINITPGTSEAAIPSVNIKELDASKLIPSSSGILKSLVLSESLSVKGNIILNGLVSLGAGGSLTVKSSEGAEVFKLGLIEIDQSSTPLYKYGLKVTDGSNTNLLVSNSGEVSVRGVVTALSGSKFTGEINLQSGNFSGDVKVGGSGSLIIKGSETKIVAGGSSLTPSGIVFNQGSINLGKFTVSETGILKATGVEISGKIIMTDGEVLASVGKVGGIEVGATYLRAGGWGATPTFPRFILQSDGSFSSIGGSFDGDIAISRGIIYGSLTLAEGGQLVLPGVTFDSEGPHFSHLELNIDNRFVLSGDGRLQATDVILSGNINLKVGSVSGLVTIGSSPLMALDGENEEIIAGESRLKGTGILFKEGEILLGVGSRGPLDDKAYNLHLSREGVLEADRVDLEGSFSGKLTGTSGSIAGLTISENALHREAESVDRSLFVLGGDGSLSAYADRLALGVTHQERLLVKIDSAGLEVDEGAVNIRTAIDGEKEVRLDSFGLHAMLSLLDEVRIQPEGVMLVKDGLESGLIITPDGFNSDYLKDRSIKAIKLSNVAPLPPQNLSATEKQSASFKKYVGSVELVWYTPDLKEDYSPYEDQGGYKVYVTSDLDPVKRCIAVLDPTPDYPYQDTTPLLGRKSYVVNNLEFNTNYQFYVTTVDVLGNESSDSFVSAFIPKIVTHPSPIQWLKVTPGVGCYGIAWDQSPVFNFDYYLVEKNFSFDGFEFSEWMYYTITYSNNLYDREVSSGAFYKYRVKVIDTNGGESDWTESEAFQCMGASGTDIANGSITSNKLDTNIRIRGSFGLEKGAIVVPDIHVLLDTTPLGSTPLDSTPLGVTPTTPLEEWIVVPQEYLRVVGDDATPTSKGIDISKIIIRHGLITVPSEISALEITDDGATPLWKNIRVGLINGVDLEGLSFDLNTHLVSYADHIDTFNSLKSSFENHDHHSNLNDPSAEEKAALAGTHGAPGKDNKYVTDTDLRLLDSAPLTHGDENHYDLSYFNSISSGVNSVLATSGLQNIELVAGEGIGIFVEPGDSSAVVTFSSTIGSTPTGDEFEDIYLSGTIIPTNINQTIGTPEARFKAIYVDEAHLSPDTLYIGDTPIFSTSESTIVIRSDPGQYIRIATDVGTEMVAAGLNAEVKILASGLGGRVVMGAMYEVMMTAPQTTVNGDLCITGDLYVNGDQVVINVQTVEVKDNVMLLNKGQVGAGVSAGQAGIRIDRGDLADALMIFDESSDKFQIGFLGGTLSNIASENYINGLLDGKVDKVAGKGLSTEDFTTAEKEKLSKIGESPSSSIDQVRKLVVNNWGYYTLSNFGIPDAICWSPELGLFAAVTGSSSVTNKVATSSDGITWQVRTATEAVYWNDVCWSSELGMFVVVGSGGTSPYRVMTSPIGSIWTYHEVEAACSSICWSPELGLFVAVAVGGTNALMTSPDGINWTYHPYSEFGTSFYSICWCPGLGVFVASGVNKVFLSQDGDNWTLHDFSSYWEGSAAFFATCWSPELGLFVGISNGSTAYKIITTTNGVDWTVSDQPENNKWKSVCWSSELGMFVAIPGAASAHHIMTSIDGSDWSLFSPFAESNAFRDICWSSERGVFIAIGSHPYFRRSLSYFK